MYTHYLKLIFRYFFKHPGYSLINLLGLSLGIATAWIIFLYIQFERSYDNFHPQVKRTYRVNADLKMGGREFPSGNTSAYMGEFIEEQMPEVEAAVTLKSIEAKLQGGSPQAAVMYESEFFFASGRFFDMFDFPLIQGDGATSLLEPSHIILTESLAQKCFPNQDAMNQIVYVSVLDTIAPFTVKGIMADFPSNTHLEIEALANLERYYQLFPESYYGWGNLSAVTYATLTDPAKKAGWDERIRTLLIEHIGEDRLWFSPYLQPLGDIHLNLEGASMGGNGDVQNLYLFAAIAILIILLACINYMNLSTARSVIRMKEIGVRKVLGVQRKQLRFQFLYEALVYSFVASLLALVVVDVSLPFVSKLFGVDMDINIWSNWQTWTFIVLAGLGTGFLAGSYPAFYLAARGKISQHFKQQREKGNFRKGLVIVQFATASLLIMGTLAITSQMRYIKSKDLGFNQDMLMYIPLRSESLEAKQITLKTEFAKISQVQKATYAGVMLGTPGGAMGFKIPGEDDERLHNVKFVDAMSREAFEFEMIAGRWFDPALPTDSMGYIVNEAFVKHYGWEDPIGKSLQKDDPKRVVIGVIKDFHFRSLHLPVEPIVMMMDANWDPNIVLKLAPENLANTLASVQEVWTEVAGSEPFEYQFQDEYQAELYLDEQRFARLFGGFSGLAIFIACLGLLALVAFTAESRTKEIGIRKVLGASVSDILLLLNKSYFRLILFGFALAVPLAWWLIQKWLENFAYKMSLSPGLFLIAGLLVMTLTIITVSYLSWKTSRLDPIKSLRYE